jgi:hypothetical protein
MVSSDREPASASAWTVSALGRRHRRAARGVSELQLEFGRHIRASFQRWQFFQGNQAQIVKKGFGGGEQRGPPGCFTLPDDFDPAALFERLDDRARHRDAADFLDIPTRHRLPVRNDRKGLEHGPRVTGRPLGVQAFQVGPHQRCTLEAPAGGQRDKFHAAPVPVAAQFIKQRAHRIGPDFIVEQTTQFGQRQGLLCRQ